jgi:hypothetical protein
LQDELPPLLDEKRTNDRRGKARDREEIQATDRPYVGDGDVTVKLRVAAEEGIAEAMNGTENMLFDEIGDLPLPPRRYLKLYSQGYRRRKGRH